MNYEFLKENAEAFLKNARDLFSKGVYQLVAFNCEQAVQLFLKYILAKKLGEFPKTHSLKRLFREVENFCPALKELAEEHITLVGDLEFAYIASRYYPAEFTHKEVSLMIEFAEKVKDLTNECLA